jgi:hypothetical protein
MYPITLRQASRQVTAKLALYTKAAVTNCRKAFEFPAPTQLFTHTQWWSILKTHLLHTEQCAALHGFQPLHIRQNLLCAANFSCFTSSGCVCSFFGMYPGSAKDAEK